MSRQKTKIEKLGREAELIVYQESAKGRSLRDIAEKINETFNENISHQSVKRYKENRGNERLANMGAKNAQQLEQEEAKELIDIGSELKETYEKLREAVDSLDAKERSDMGLLIQLSKELRKQWKFHKEFVEEIVRPDKVENNVEINKTQMAIKISDKLEELEDKGVITIHKPEKV